MNEIAVSVILPIYNCELYLNQCLESIVKQSLKNIEIICVDDGSTDDSVRIIKSFQSLDNRIHLIRQHNLYAGVARNNGLKYAHGKYIIFLDSDDFFELSMLNTLFNIAEKRNVDIVHCGYWEYDNKTHKEVPRQFFRPRGVKSPNELGKDVFNLTEPVPWNKLIKRDLIINTGLEFQEVKNGNDEFFNRAITISSSNMFFLKRRFVHYRVNNISSLQGSLKKTLNEIETCFRICSGLKEYMMSSGLMTDSFKEAYKAYAQRMVYQRMVYAYTSFETASRMFIMMKNRLVPEVFENEKDFEKHDFLSILPHSNTVEEYMCNSILYFSKNYVSKHNQSFVIGEFVLKPIRFLRNLLHY